MEYGCCERQCPSSGADICTESYYYDCAQTLSTIHVIESNQYSCTEQCPETESCIQGTKMRLWSFTAVIISVILLANILDFMKLPAGTLVMVSINTNFFYAHALS